MATEQLYELDGQTEFYFPHPVRSPAQIVVETVPGLMVPPASYEVIGYSPTATGVTVRYPDAPRDGTLQLKISRRTEVRRVSEFPDDLSITARALDAEFDNIIQIVLDGELWGQILREWEEMQLRYAEFLAASGYEFIGDYGAGIVITEYNQLIRDADGEFWRLSGQVDLPYTTTGDWGEEEGLLVAVGDASLRQDLSDPTVGPSMVAMPDGNTIADLQSQDPDKGANMVGFDGDGDYVGGSVGRAVLSTREAAISDRNLFKRSIVAEFPFRGPNYDSLCSDRNYPYLYPQSFAIDEDRDEIFILTGPPSGDDMLAWIWVYTFSTGAYKTVFTTGQRWKESLVLMNEGNARYLYTIGQSTVIRVDVTSLPPELGTATILDTGVPGYSFLTFTGECWVVQNPIGAFFRARRNMYAIYSRDFSEAKGDLTLPFGRIGDLGASMAWLPKAQGIAWHNGYLYVTSGGPYGLTAAPPLDPTLPRYFQGLQVFDSSGALKAEALTAPHQTLELFRAGLGVDIEVIETEGLCSHKDKLYSIWQTMSPPQRTLPISEEHGIVIALEASEKDSALDFSSFAVGPFPSFNSSDFQQKNHHSSGTLRHPLTGEPLDSMLAITQMMNDLGLSKYSYSGTNQTLEDVNGLSVPISGALVEFENTNGYTFIVKINSLNVGNTVKYFLQDQGTTQVGPLHDDVRFGLSNNSVWMRYGSGVQECWTIFRGGAACDTPTGSIFRSDSTLSWTFPQEFNSTYPVHVTVDAMFGTRWGTTTGAATSTGVSVVILCASNDPTNRPFTVKASGRWR